MQRKLREIEEYPDYVGFRHPLNVLAFPHGPWEVGAGVILSADCADATVNRTLPRFLALFPTPESVRAVTVNAIVPHLQGISHRGHKAQYLIAWSKYLLERGGDVGDSVQTLTQVHGVGRKSAALILYRIKGIDEGMPLDTHALRVLDRLGWYFTVRAPASSCLSTDWCSAVGMFFRLASSCLRVTTDLRVGDFLAMIIYFRSSAARSRWRSSC